MLDNTVFYIVFIIQILLLSYYIPSRFIKRINQVMIKYPESEYPKLYPQGIDYNKSRKDWFSWMNRIILALGFVSVWLFYMWAEANDGEINQMFPWAYFMLQMLPLMLLEQSGFRQIREMREADIRKKRKADLTPRNFFDFVSPRLFGSAVMAYLLLVIFLFVIHDFDFSLGGKPVLMSLIVLAGNVFFAAMIAFILHGKTSDPYQDMHDRRLKIKHGIKPMMYISIAVSIYCAVQAGISQYDWDFLEPILMSIYCQLITVMSVGTQLNNVRVEDLNFDVYKKDAPSN